MKLTNLLPVLLSGFLLSSAVAAQNPNDNRSIYEPSREVEILREKQQAADLRNGKDENGMIKQPSAEPKQISAELKNVYARKALENAEKTTILKEAEQKLLAPSQYYEKYASFLLEKKTGLARIFVDKGCGIGKKVSAAELENCGDVIPVRGGGAFYSFRYKSNHFYGISDGWDLYLYKGHKFLAGNDTVQTLIADLGNVNFDELSLKSKAFDFLDDYDPVSSLAEIKEKNKILKNGISANGYTYSNMANVNLDSTYIVRTVAYKRSKFLSHGTDLTLAFKIVGREPDGSLIILWRELKSELPRRELS